MMYVRSCCINTRFFVTQKVNKNAHFNERTNDPYNSSYRDKIDTNLRGFLAILYILKIESTFNFSISPLVFDKETLVDTQNLPKY